MYYSDEVVVIVLVVVVILLLLLLLQDPAPPMDESTPHIYNNIYRNISGTVLTGNCCYNYNNCNYYYIIIIL